MDIDDLLADLFGDASADITAGRRAGLLFRMLFGLAGGFLGVAGAWVMLTRESVPGAASLRAGMALVLIALAAVSLCNVMLGRAWRWPWLSLAGAVVGLFVIRLTGV